MGVQGAEIDLRKTAIDCTRNSVLVIDVLKVYKCWQLKVTQRMCRSGKNRGEVSQCKKGKSVVREKNWALYGRNLGKT
ncbi:hypothetical protein L596_009078 [Steinernema carpocapsae]|uniref:Uncharacterized protein n=1 Tax=Steinernema carpocapsae TaxID=34508 RepID=A0A4U5PEV5_STECR|nr:hypothetical protein L596_009078 [Steinernema carpocapsae]